jgi:hypothetical protein
MGVIDPLKRFLHLKMLNSAPKWHKLMPEIPNVRFSCWNSNIRDLLQIWPLKFRLTSTTRRDSPQIMLKSEKTCPQNRLKNTGCKGIHATERPGTFAGLFLCWLVVGHKQVTCPMDNLPVPCDNYLPGAFMNLSRATNFRIPGMPGWVDLGAGGKWKILRVNFIIQFKICAHRLQPVDMPIKQS